MLQTQTVSAECLELLRQISGDDFFSEYVLFGGTALALQMGHRNSIDLDFFGNKEIDEELYLEKLKQLGEAERLSASKSILITSVNGIKVDFVHHRYPWIAEKMVIDHISFASQKDIAAMKLEAIAGRGSKKDFIDLYFLLGVFSLEEMIGFWRKKYPQFSEFGMLKSITYFEDAEKEEAPDIFFEFNWESCKNRIRTEFDKLTII